MIVDELFAPVDCRGKVGVPDCATVHADDFGRPDLVWEQEWKGSRGHDGLDWVRDGLVEYVVGA